MKLIDLINVLDSDTKVHIVMNYKELFDGSVSEIFPAKFNFTALESVVKAVWYSKTMNCIVIEV